MSAQTTAPLALMDVNEAARLLNVTARTVHTLTKDQKLSSIRVGRCLRFSIHDLNAYIDSQRTGSSKQAEPALS